MVGVSCQPLMTLVTILFSAGYLPISPFQFKPGTIPIATRRSSFCYFNTTSLLALIAHLFPWQILGLILLSSTSVGPGTRPALSLNTFAAGLHLIEFIVNTLQYKQSKTNALRVTFQVKFMAFFLKTPLQHSRGNRGEAGGCLASRQLTHLERKLKAWKLERTDFQFQSRAGMNKVCEKSRVRLEIQDGILRICSACLLCGKVWLSCFWYIPPVIWKFRLRNYVWLFSLTDKHANLGRGVSTQPSRCF